AVKLDDGVHLPEQVRKVGGQPGEKSFVVVRRNRVSELLQSHHYSAVETPACSPRAPSPKAHKARTPTGSCGATRRRRYNSTTAPPCQRIIPPPKGAGGERQASTRASVRRGTQFGRPRLNGGRPDEIVLRLVKQPPPTRADQLVIEPSQRLPVCGQRPKHLLIDELQPELAVMREQVE